MLDAGEAFERMQVGAGRDGTRGVWGLGEMVPGEMGPGKDLSTGEHEVVVGWPEDAEALKRMVHGECWVHDLQAQPLNMSPTPSTPSSVVHQRHGFRIGLPVDIPMCTHPPPRTRPRSLRASRSATPTPWPTMRRSSALWARGRGWAEGPGA